MNSTEKKAVRVELFLAGGTFEVRLNCLTTIELCIRSIWYTVLHVEVRCNSYCMYAAMNGISHSLKARIMCFGCVADDVVYSARIPFASKSNSPVLLMG